MKGLYSLGPLPERWPDWRAISVLCYRALGSFTYASTFTKLIMAHPYFPTLKFDVILALPQKATNARKKDRPGSSSSWRKGSVGDGIWRTCGHCEGVRDARPVQINIGGREKGRSGK